MNPCPVDGCGLRSIEHRGTRIAVCDECHGVWLARKELRSLRMFAAGAHLPGTAPRASTLLRRSSARHCPLCRTVALAARFVGEIEVDVCLACRGVWLDPGELERIIDRCQRVPTSQRLPPFPPGETAKAAARPTADAGLWADLVEVVIEAVPAVGRLDNTAAHCVVGFLAEVVNSVEF